MDWKDVLAGMKDKLPPGEEKEREESAAGGENAPAEAQNSAATTHKEKISVVIERKGRKGKTATIACGFLCSDEELAELASRARKKLGTGGSSRGGEILMQGECRERLVDFLHSEGYGNVRSS